MLRLRLADHRIVWASCLAALLPLLAAQAAFAQQKKPPAADLGDSLDILDDLGADDKQRDLDKLRTTHLSLVRTWQGVRPDPVPTDGKQTFAWAAAKGLVSPLGDGKISTLVAVPEKAKYRVYLRQVLTAQEKRAVTLRLAPLAPEAGAALSHEFGAFTFLDGQKGKDQEAKLPIRVESDLQLNTIPDNQMPVWEYWDVELPAGAFRASLESAKTSPQVDALLITQSTSFRPSFSHIAKDNSLERIFIRFRLVGPGTRPATFGVTANLGYHWRGRVGRSGEELWYYSVGAASGIAGQQWSPFLDAAEAIVPAPGPWSTCRVQFQNVTNGQVEVQLAWSPQEAAVVHTFETAISGGEAMFRVPSGTLLDQTVAAEPRWGVWNIDKLAAFEPEEKLVERYYEWADEAADSLKLPSDQPGPKELLVLSSCRVSAAQRGRAAEMLARLGVNWIEGAPADVVKRLGLYDESRFTKVKAGDEIGTLTPASAINASPALLSDFHHYLIAQAELAGTTANELFGVTSLDRLRCLDRMPDNPGRFERRLFYHSHRFCHQATVAEYAKTVQQAEAADPKAVVYNNYSPHPVFLTGHTMNEGDWFLLCRAGAQTLGWAEDWAYNGSWALGTDRAQCVSFYAALVDCAVRAKGYPAGFYVGSNTGNSATKIFSCVAQGIDILHLYDWGPIDGWPEGSNAWSENRDEYKSVMIATHALGPADEIIAKGEREPRRTAVLYNRAHEIMNGETVVLNHDWMWAFLMLKSAQIPADVIIEEDLTPEGLAPYRVLYLGGLNLEARHLRAVTDWVRAGGLLVGSGGSALFDAYNSLNPETSELFGARQVLAPPSASAESETVSFTKSEVYPKANFAIASPAGHHYVLEPTEGKPLAKYGSGGCAAVTNAVGKGRTILLGFYPGFAYRGAERALGPVGPWFVAPLRAQLGTPKLTFSYPAAEATLFEHASGLAVTLANFSPGDKKPADEPTRLSVTTDRPIRAVTSALRGPLQWKRVGERIEIETPSPADLWVDTVILR